MQQHMKAGMLLNSVLIFEFSPPCFPTLLVFFCLFHSLFFLQWFCWWKRIIALQLFQNPEFADHIAMMLFKNPFIYFVTLNWVLYWVRVNQIQVQLFINIWRQCCVLWAPSPWPSWKSLPRWSLGGCKNGEVLILYLFIYLLSRLLLTAHPCLAYLEMQVIWKSKFSVCGSLAPLNVTIGVFVGYHSALLALDTLDMFCPIPSIVLPDDNRVLSAFGSWEPLHIFWLDSSSLSCPTSSRLIL